MTRLCLHCNALKPVTEFAPSSRSRDGVRGYCNACCQACHIGAPYIPPLDPVRPRRGRGGEKAMLYVDIPKDLKQELVDICTADAARNIATTLTSLVCEALEDFLEARAQWEKEA